MTNSTTSLIDLARRLRIEEGTRSCATIAEMWVGTGEARDGGIHIPESQREWAWKAKRGTAKMVKLVDSLLHNYPVPGVILNFVGRKYYVYDGRHRLETIWRFLNNQFKVDGRFYRDLSEGDRDKLDNRAIPVTVVCNATSEQLADIFIRLNSGAPLSDSDMFWAYRDTPLVKATLRLVTKNERLKAALGGCDLENRRDLANWVAHVVGLSEHNAGLMSTSYIRAAESGTLVKEVHEERVKAGLAALCELYERANSEAVVSEKEQRTYKKIGKVNAFFLADLMTAATTAERAECLDKWAWIVTQLRGNDKARRAMESALRTTGAQNLNTTKIENVLQQVNTYLDTHEVQIADDVESIDSDDE